MNINSHFKIAADFDVTLRKIAPDGSVVSERTPVKDCKNLITDTGMDRIGSGAFYDFCQCLQVGTGNTAPAYTNTALVARRQGVNRGLNPALTYDGNVCVATMTFTFATGQASGVLAELGLSVTTSGTLSTRALFRDSGGTPITVTVLSDEELVVTYRLRFTPSLTTDSQVYNRKGVDYTVTLRPAQVGVAVGHNLHSAGRLSAFAYTGTGASVIARRFIGGSGVGDYSAFPSGTAQNIEEQFATRTYGTYTNGTYYRDDTYAMASAQQNVANVTGWEFYGYPVRIQIGVSPAISKTSADALGFTVRTSWSRE